MKNIKHTNKFKPYFRASMQADGVLEMLVYSQIGESWDGSGVTANSVKEQLDSNGSYNNIVLRINSPGGDVFEGVAIGNLLRAQKKPILVCIDGVAASSASIIAMAGDEIEMGSNAIMMIHNAWSMAIGDARDMRKMADTLDVVTGAVAQTYCDKTGQSMKSIQALMDAETWFNATDAISGGFATRISEQSSDGAANAIAKSFKALKTYKNVPAALKNDSVSCDCTCESCTEGDCGNCDNTQCVDPSCMENGCPMQGGMNDKDRTEITNLSLYEARLKLLRYV